MTAMFRKRVVRPTALLALVFLGISLTAMPVAAGAVVVPNGTRVLLSFTTPVSPSTNAEGSTTVLSVVNDVVVNDSVVVVKAGTSVQGEILRSRKRSGLGKAAEIAVIVRSVPAVDGSAIPVSATKSVEGDSKVTEAVLVAILCCILGLLIKGSDAGIAQGTNVEATTAGNATVQIP